MDDFDITASIVGSGLGTNSPLYQILMAQSISPGDPVSYECAKLVYTYHPLGKAIVDSPVNKAFAKRRIISLGDDTPQKVIERYWETWDAADTNRHFKNTQRLSRIYGVSSVAINSANSRKPLSPSELHNGNVTYTEFDPLNTAGSLVGNLNPNDQNFLNFLRWLFVEFHLTSLAHSFSCLMIQYT